jgi:hypothetical protein
MNVKIERELTVQERTERDAGERFRHDIGAWKNETTGRETKAHEMTVLRDDGLYRHVKFAKPQSGFYWFELLTWPGHLTINGDMGCFTFARVTDMFTFFRGDRINTTYWAEKVQGSRGGIEEYSEGIFREHVLEAISDHEEDFPGLADAVKEQILDELDGFEDNARELVRDFEFGSKPHFRFVDAWEWDVKDYSIGFLWCCYAIQWGIAMYDKAKAGSAAVDQPVSSVASNQPAEEINNG